MHKEWRLRIHEDEIIRKLRQNMKSLLNLFDSGQDQVLLLPWEKGTLRQWLDKQLEVTYKDEAVNWYYKTLSPDFSQAPIELAHETQTCQGIDC